MTTMLSAESGELISAPSLPNESLLAATVGPATPTSSSDLMQDIPTPALESLTPQSAATAGVVVGGMESPAATTATAVTTGSNLRRPLLVQVCSALSADAIIHRALIS